MRLKRRALHSLLLAGLLFLAVPLLFVCCSQRWLPDSSGFVYVSHTGSVVHYDLKSKTAKRLAQGSFTDTSVAVWPTGDRVVVARVQKRKQQSELQISLYDLEGNEKHKSPAFQLEKKGNDPMPFQTYVSPDKKHIVSFLSEAGALIYNVEQRKFRSVPKAMPVHWGFSKSAAFFDVSPVLPNGKGFLAATGGDGDPRIELHGWDGAKPKKLRMDPRIKDLTFDRGNQGVRTIFRWEMGLFVSRIQKGIVTINPHDLTVTYADDKISETLLAHAEKHKVLVLYELRDRALVQASKDELQLWTPDRGGKTTSILKVGKNTFVTLAPGPNRKSILVRSLGQSDRFLVVNSKGQLIAEMNEKPKN